MLDLREITNIFCENVNKFKKLFRSNNDDLSIFKKINENRMKQELRKEISDNLKLFWKFAPYKKFPNWESVVKISEKLSENIQRCEYYKYSVEKNFIINCADLNIQIGKRKLQLNANRRLEKKGKSIFNDIERKDTIENEIINTSGRSINLANNDDVKDNKLSKKVKCKKVAFEDKLKEIKEKEEEERIIELRKLEDLTLNEEEETKDNFKNLILLDNEENINENYKTDKFKKMNSNKIEIITNSCNISEEIYKDNQIINMKEHNSKSVSIKENIENDSNEGDKLIENSHKIQIFNLFKSLESPSSFAYNYNDNLLFVGTITGKIMIYDIISGQITRILNHVQNSKIKCLFFASNTQTLISLAKEGTIFQYNLLKTSEEQLYSESVSIGGLLVNKNTVYFYKKNSILSIDLNNTSLFCEVASFDYKVKQFKLYEPTNLMIIATSDGELKLFNYNTKENILTIKHNYYFNIVKYNEIEVLAIAETENEINLYSLQEYYYIECLNISKTINFKKIIDFYKGNIVGLKSNNEAFLIKIENMLVNQFDGIFENVVSLNSQSTSLFVGCIANDIYIYNY